MLRSVLKSLLLSSAFVSSMLFLLINACNPGTLIIYRRKGCGGWLVGQYIIDLLLVSLDFLFSLVTLLPSLLLIFVLWRPSFFVLISEKKIVSFTQLSLARPSLISCSTRL